MESEPGLRERKKRETRRRVANVAARLFAQHGFDAVSVSDVARAADVADQTVYNYFPTKPELVLDRAAEILERTRRAVAERTSAETPADAIALLVREDIERFRGRDLAIARGEFPAQSLTSDALRRYALEFRHTQAEAVASAIIDGDRAIAPLVALAHASALVGVIDAVTVRIGTAILSEADRDATADELRLDADAALADAAENYRSTRRRLRGAT